MLQITRDFAFVNYGSPRFTNCAMKLVRDPNYKKGYLCLFATCDIYGGMELPYNYGDKRKNMWWRQDQVS